MLATVLYIFDIDGTLIRSFMREGARDRYDDIELLPKRVKMLRSLAYHGAEFALATNQGGVAFGYQSTDQVWDKIGRLTGQLEGFYSRPVSYHVCFHHPKATVVGLNDPVACQRRKPSGEMLLEACQAHRLSKENALYIGDMETDQQAAEAAGISYCDAEDFFF